MRVYNPRAVADAVALLDPSPPRPNRRSRLRPELSFVTAAALLGVTLLAYFRFLGVGFVATDSLPLIETSRLTNLADVAELFRKPVMAGTPFANGEIVYRPFVSVLFGIDYALWGLNPLGYHVTNLALHLLSVFMVWRLLGLLGLRWWSSLIGAAVFALHPLAAVSIPVIARRDSVAPVTAFMTAWVLLIVAQRAHGGRRILALSGSVLLAIIALLSKESAFVAVGLLPVLVAARAYADGVGWRTAVKRCTIVAPYVVAAGVVFVVRYRVLGGMGGSVDTSSPPLYTQVLGAFTRDLTWSFAALASSNHQAWPILAGVLLPGLGVGSAFLPRRQAVLALLGLTWLLGFAIFAMVFRIMTIGWLAYFAVPGLAIVWAAGAEGAVARLRLRSFRLPQLTSAVLLLALGGLGLGWFATSALVRSYSQWQYAGEVSRHYLDGLASCVSATPEITHVRLDSMPSLLDDGQPETNQLGVTLFEDYTIQSALRLFFPHQDHTLTVWSRETLHSVGETANLACVSDTSRIYLVATY